MALHSYFWWCGYFWGPCVSFVKTDELSVRVTKNTSRIGVSWTHTVSKFTQWIMDILSKWCKPDIFEPHNSLKLSFTNIWGLPSNFAECESFIESNSPETLGQTWMTQLILTISLWGVIFLYSKQVILLICMVFHLMSFSLWLPFAPGISLENSAASYLCFWLALLHSMSFF